MKRLAWILTILIFPQLVSAQAVNLKEWVSLLNLHPNKLETHLQKKGFKPSGSWSEEEVFSKIKVDSNGTTTRSFRLLSGDEQPLLQYTTPSRQEFQDIQQELLSSGFHGPAHISDSTQPIVYQKENYVFSVEKEQQDSTTVYQVRASRKIIPRLKDIVYAEDLLPLDSHEYLAETFGKQNVKKDLFYLSATEAKKCTIIFPNSSRQAIFLWKDEENMRDISFVLIGDQLNNNKNENAITLSDWRSSQGVYCGMSLGEIQNLNTEPISFYNWETASAGFLTPQNKGQIDFETLKPVFSCMNCSFLYVDKDVSIIQSSHALEENQKVYVASFVLLPEKKKIPARQISLK